MVFRELKKKKKTTSPLSCENTEKVVSSFDVNRWSSAAGPDECMETLNLFSAWWDLFFFSSLFFTCSLVCVLFFFLPSMWSSHTFPKNHAQHMPFRCELALSLFSRSHSLRKLVFPFALPHRVGRDEWPQLVDVLVLEMCLARDGEVRSYGLVLSICFSRMVAQPNSFPFLGGAF